MAKKKVVPVMLRLPEDLYEVVSQRSTAEHRSMNAQIAHMLYRLLEVEEKIAQSSTNPPPPTRQS